MARSAHLETVTIENCPQVEATHHLPTAAKIAKTESCLPGTLVDASRAETLGAHIVSALFTEADALLMLLVKL